MAQKNYNGDIISTQGPGYIRLSLLSTYLTTGEPRIRTLPTQKTSISTQASRAQIQRLYKDGLFHVPSFGGLYFYFYLRAAPFIFN